MLFKKKEKQQEKENKPKEAEVKDFSLTKSLRGWRKERNIKSITRETYVKQVLEELFELYGLQKEQVKTNTQALYDTWFLHLASREVSVDILLDGAEDNRTFSTNFIELLGYDEIKVSEEVFKEINSRKQDPKQKELWDKGQGLEQKWQKDQNQPKETLYEADFSNCKLNEV